MVKEEQLECGLFLYIVTVYNDFVYQRLECGGIDHVSLTHRQPVKCQVKKLEKSHYVFFSFSHFITKYL